MVTFHVPTRQTGAAALVFRVPRRAVLLAGSRNAAVPQETAASLVEHLTGAGFGFLIGCAPGADAVFRSAVDANPDAREHTFVACAFDARAREDEQAGLAAGVVVPQGLSPAAALHRRTLWMVKRCVLLILFPDDPRTGRWGPGSTLAFRTTLFQLKPVFVATQNKPKDSPHYRLIRDSFFGIMDGYWAVPHPTELGTCDEEW